MRMVDQAESGLYFYLSSIASEIFAHQFYWATATSNKSPERKCILQLQIYAMMAYSHLTMLLFPNASPVVYSTMNQSCSSCIFAAVQTDNEDDDVAAERQRIESVEFPRGSDDLVILKNLTKVSLQHARLS